jgi:deoxyribonuclease V
MRVKTLHPWTLTPREAISLQKKLADRVICENQVEAVRYVAGADIATFKDSSRAYAGVVVMTFPDLKIVEEKGMDYTLSFSYIPGLLSFRESPALLKVFENLEHEPDLVLMDGQGLAHPRRFGIACHLGLLLDKPTIGCAKSRLFGHHKEPLPERGSFADLCDDHGNVIGAVLRTKDRTNPLFISIGYQVDLPTAIHYTLACCQGYRLPEPTRQAHLFVGKISRAARGSKIKEPILRKETASEQLNLLDNG